MKSASWVADRGRGRRMGARRGGGERERRRGEGEKDSVQICDG